MEKHPRAADEYYWRDRAEELRLRAASVHHPGGKELFLMMAASYLKVAEWVKRGASRGLLTSFLGGFLGAEPARCD